MKVGPINLDPTRISWKDWNMDSIKNILGTVWDNWFLKIILGSLVSLNDWIFAPKQDTVAIVMAFVALDTASGLMKAYKTGTISSSGFFRCGLKLLVYTILLAAGSLLDKVTSMDAVISALSVIATYLATTETISIFENAASLGFKIPANLLKVLKFAKGDDESRKP